MTTAMHQILLVEDEPGIRGVVRLMLQSANYRIVEADTAARAEIEARTHRPDLLIVDLGLPDGDGLDVIRRVRAWSPVPIIVLSARTMEEQKVAALDAGADDYVVKPFDPEELRARVHVGIRVLNLQERLAERVVELQDALSRVKQLHGLLPICSYCKRIRTDDNYWHQVDRYIVEHSDAEFTHGICPTCYETVLAEFPR